MPEVTTVGLQEAARTSATLSQNLDRLANFAFRQAEVEAQIKGAEYGALNAPTQQQLDDAIAAGEDVTKIVPGDTATVFGRAARKSALSALSTEFEIETRKAIVGLQTSYENKEIGLEQLESGMSALVAEQTDILRRISPQAATQFSASVGLVSNAAYLSAAKDAAKEARIDQEIRFRDGVNLYIRNAEAIVRAGATVGEDGTVVTVDQKIDALREQIAIAAQEIDDPEFYEAKIGELDKAIVEAKVGVVMDEALLYPEHAMKVIYGDGKFEDAEVQATFDTMNADEKRQLISQIQSAQSTKFSLESAADAKRTRQRGERSDELQADFTAAILSDDRVTAQSVLDQLEAVDPAAYESKLEVFSTDAGVNDRDTVTTLRRLSLANKLTQRDVDNAFSVGKLDMSTYKEFMNDLESQRNQTYNKAIDWLKSNRGVPEGTLLNFNVVQQAADREVAQIKVELLEALNEDPSIDPFKFVKDKVAELEAEAGDLGNSALRQQAFKLGETLRSQMPGASAQELFDKVTSDPNFYPNPQRRQNAIDNLLPLLIQLEAQQ